MTAFVFEDLGAEAALTYWREEGLEALCMATTAEAAAIPPQITDLVRLHRLARLRMSVTALEFGVGYSTIVLADALARNQAAYDALPTPPRLRAQSPFRVHTVDASRDWLNHTRRRLSEALTGRVHFHHSSVSVGTWNGRLCHFYDSLPDIVPDFIYLDGPDPKDVQGSLRGLSFRAPDRTVMAADLLAMESVLLPGCTILCDGRVNNARFLAANFQRPFVLLMPPSTDITIFYLNEPPLGPHSHDLATIVSASKVHRA